MRWVVVDSQSNSVCCSYHPYAMRLLSLLFKPSVVIASSCSHGREIMRIGKKEKITDAASGTVLLGQYEILYPKGLTFLAFSKEYQSKVCDTYDVQSSILISHLDANHVTRRPSFQSSRTL